MKWLVIAALVLAGCKKKQDQPAPAPETGSAMATGSAMGTTGSAAPDMAATGSAAGSAAVDVPTEQDFEDKAASDITDKNVDAKLKNLEADLATH